MKLLLVTWTMLVSSSVSQQTLSGGMREFTRLLLAELEEKSQSNFLFSPFSLHSVLSQVMLGSRGRTLAQLEQVLGVRASEDLLSQYRTVATDIASGSAQLNTGNELAVALGFKPKSSFNQLLARTFGSRISEYDFAGNGAGAVRQINDLVSQKTEGKIKDLLLEQDVDSLTRMILINVIYFKAQWKIAFNIEDSRAQIFNSPLAGEVNTTFMNINDKFRIYEDQDGEFEILELPYADQTMSMLIILPASPTTQVSSKLEGFNFTLIKEEPLRDAQVSIPKFNMKYQTYLKKTITNLGAGDVFSSESDLSGISDQPLYVTEGVHQANIEVNEEGSEAAAATGVVVGVRTIRRKKQFFADTPFLFMIYDFQNNIPLFAGKVVDPTNTIQVQDPPERSAVEPQVSLGGSLADPQSQQPPNIETCKRLLRDFPTAYDNYKICEKVKEAGKFLDWLRANRNLCETSEDHYKAFQTNNCGGVWCEMASSQRGQWEADYQAQCGEGETESNQQECKIIENKLKAFNALSC